MTKETAIESAPVEIKSPSNPAKEEQMRLTQELFKAIPSMAADYKILVRHTGGLLSASMAVAYSKGLNDALKLILKEKK